MKSRVSDETWNRKDVDAERTKFYQLGIEEGRKRLLQEFRILLDVPSLNDLDRVQNLVLQID